MSNNSANLSSFIASLLTCTLCLPVAHAFTSQTKAQRPLPTQAEIVAAQAAREHAASLRSRLYVSLLRKGETRAWSANQCVQSGDTLQILLWALDRDGANIQYWDLPESEILRLRDQPGYLLAAYAPGKWMFSGLIPAREGSRVTIAASSDPALNRPWDFASVGRPQIAFVYGYMLQDREPISATLSRATETTIGWAESDGGVLLARVTFTLDTGQYELLCDPEKEWLIVSARVKRGAKDRSGDRELWRLLRSAALEQDAPGRPTEEELKVTEEVVWQLQESVQEAQTWLPRSGRGKVARRGHPAHLVDFEYQSTFTSAGEITPAHDLWAASLNLVPEGIEATLLTDLKSDGLYREWRNGKPVVVERPKVQETIDQAVQQTLAVTRPPDSSRTQLYLLLGGAALLIALAVGLSWYHARVKR